MRVLVTGASGFVGYVVAAQLVKSGHEVLGLTRSDSSPLPGDVIRVTGNLLDIGTVSQAVSQVDAVCHLAALVQARESFTAPLTYWRTNVTGTLQLLQAIAESPASRLVLASTCAVHGTPPEQPISELAPLAPSSPYGTSKLAADHAAADLARTGTCGAISLRAFNIAGAAHGRPDSDSTRLIPRLLAVRQGQTPEFSINGDGSAVRDFLHVTDMASAFLLALDACTPGQWRAYNVGSGQGHTVREVISTVESVTGGLVPTRRLSAAVEPPKLLADSSRIRSELGWFPKKPDLHMIVSDAWSALTSD